MTAPGSPDVPAPAATEQRHATAVSVLECGVLLLGPSGVGKSDLALRLIDEGGQLIADDQVILQSRKGVVWATPPEGWAGIMEVHGMGIVHIGGGAPTPTPSGVVIDLDTVTPVDRMPEAASMDILGITLPVWRINAHSVSATAKVRLAVRLATKAILLYEDAGLLNEDRGD